MEMTTIDHIGAALTEFVTAYVRKFYPGKVVNKITFNPKGVPDEGFFLTVEICYDHEIGRDDAKPDTLYLNAWISTGPFVRDGGRGYDVIVTSEGITFRPWAEPYVLEDDDDADDVLHRDAMLRS